MWNRDGTVTHNGKLVFTGMHLPCVIKKVKSCPDFLPMVRAFLETIDGKPVRVKSYREKYAIEVDCWRTGSFLYTYTREGFGTLKNSVGDSLVLLEEGLTKKLCEYSDLKVSVFFQRGVRMLMTAELKRFENGLSPRVQANRALAFRRW